MRIEPIKDIADLIKLRQSLGEEKRFCFRGQANSSWDLIPSIFRALSDATSPIEDIDGGWVGRCERDIYREFQRRSIAHVETRDSWESLCIAQHYGVPTRLLDWTRNLLVAAYFALMNPDPKANKVAVWCLNLTHFPFPQALGRQVPKGSYRLDNIKRYAGDTPASFFQPVSEPLSTLAKRLNTSPPNGAFIVFEVPTVVPRIENQGGLFAVYLSFDEYDLIWNYSDYIAQIELNAGLELLVKAEIPKSEANKIRTQLEQAGIDPYRLFPDLMGLGMLLKDEQSRAFQFYLDERKTP